MSAVKANAKWLAPLACGMLVAGAAIGWAEVKTDLRPRAQAHDVRGLSTVFRDVAKRARPGIVTIVTTGKPVNVGRSLPFDSENDNPFGEMFRNNPQFREFFRNQQSPQHRSPMVPHGMGSGFVIDPKGVILTNGHVVRDAQEVTVRFADGREARATDIKTDSRTDLAIVRIKPEEAGHLEAVPMGNSDAIDVGDWVLAIGSPFGLDMTVTAGIISAKGRSIDKTDREDYIQTDAAINPGNSGGPLLNLDGEVIGINTAISTNSGQYAGVGFAIPINMAHWVADQLMSKGEVQRAYLGVGIQPVEGNLARVLNLPSGHGAVVTKVNAGAPADQAGLQSQDVVLDFNGQKVTGPRDLQGIVERLEVGKKYEMSILRDGKPMTLTVTAKAMPKDYSKFAREEEEQAAPEADKSKESASFDELGIEIKELTPETAKELRLKDVKGVVVATVKPGTPAANAGLREGMVIERVNRQVVTNPEQFEAAMKKASLKKGVIFEVRTFRGTTLMPILKG